LAGDLGAPGDPWLLADMAAAVERLLAARNAGQTVVVYGDYDADGVCATALLYETLRAAGCAARWYIPDRFEEGYGLNPSALTRLKAEGADLVVSVDCGIRSVEAAESARRAGLDLIVSDHHLPGRELPRAVAVVNPNRHDDPYPFKGLSGAGVALKVARALLEAAGVAEPPGMVELVAIGTIADLAPLQGENRTLVRAGLRSLGSTLRPGLQALGERAGLDLRQLTANSVGFSLAPRLNAAGRLANAALAVELLLAGPGPEAVARAEALDRLNRERQRLTTEMVEHARRTAIPSQGPSALIAACDPTFHEGVVGLVAGRLADEYFLPAVVATVQSGSIRGSARSIPDFHITHALDECSELLARFGGHAAAAGFGLEAANWEPFVAKLAGIAGRELAGVELQPRLAIDALVGFDQLDDELMRFLDRLEPCGEGNPAPLLATRQAAVLSKRAVGADHKHLKLTLRQGGRAFDAIGFNLGDRLAEVTPSIDLAFRLERNEYRGVTSLQLVVEDFRPS
jgi:single-stranded-DNA-specific exonuclease